MIRVYFKRSMNEILETTVNEGATLLDAARKLNISEISRDNTFRMRKENHRHRSD